MTGACGVMLASGPTAEVCPCSAFTVGGADPRPDAISETDAQWWCGTTFCRVCGNQSNAVSGTIDHGIDCAWETTPRAIGTCPHNEVLHAPDGE